MELKQANKRSEQALDFVDDALMQIAEHKDHLDNLIEKMETMTMREFAQWMAKEAK